MERKHTGTKRTKLVDIRQEKSVIAHEGVAVYVKRHGKYIRTSCLFGLELILEFIETADDPDELKMMSKALKVAARKAKVKL